MKNIVVILALVAGCSSSDDGAAPTITQLTFAPATVPAGQQSTVSGTFAFADEDGDAAQLGIDITLPDGTSQALPMTDLQNVGDMTSGTIGYSIFVTPPTPGSYKFVIFITDDGDNESNKLMGTLTAN